MESKKGASLKAWTFGIIFIMLILIIVSSSILAPMNETYGKDFSTGLDTSSIDNFQTTREASHTQIGTGEVESTTEGLSLKSAWSVGKLSYDTIISFVSGSFIRRLFTDILGLPEIVATIITLISWLGLVFIIIYIFMKVKP